MEQYWMLFLLIFTSEFGTYINGEVQPDVIVTKLGGSLIFNCSLESITRCTWTTSYGYAFVVPGKAIEPARLIPVKTSQNLCLLTILYVMKMDVGMWHCSHPSNKNISKVFNVILEANDNAVLAFKANGKPNDTIVDNGKGVNLSCQFIKALNSCVWNTPYGIILSTFSNNYNPEPQRLIPAFNASSHSCDLQIIKTVEKDNGVWTCSVTSLIKETNRVCEIGKALITISKAPRKILIHPKEVFAVQNKSFLVTCVVEYSRPKPRRLLWYIDKVIQDPIIVKKSVIVDFKGYVNYSETVSLIGHHSYNGKFLMCVYEHIAHHNGKDKNATKIRINVEAMSIGGHIKPLKIIESFFVPFLVGGILSLGVLKFQKSRQKQPEIAELPKVEEWPYVENELGCPENDDQEPSVDFSSYNDNDYLVCPNSS